MPCCAVLLCRVLLWRELLSVTRNPADVAGRCLIFTWLAVFVGLIFYNLPVTVDGLRARLNVLFVEPVILLLLPYVYMSLFTSDKQYFIQGRLGRSHMGDHPHTPGALMAQHARHAAAVSNTNTAGAITAHGAA